ncbi:MAG: outer membrane receptor for ferrienterochelin and [Chitinophagaceae bacterium]|nr:MAG: outer membrane receptor for ferrienterochelin and [Chitinophagaceae bacterium]
MVFKFCILSLAIIGSANTTAQKADTLSGTGNEIIVTATRTERKLSNVAVPVSIINQKRIQQNGSLRLNDILQEQPGIYLTNGFGTGVQMQGLNPDYTLILLDGEPMVGRTAGVLDLNRITVGNIKQIEIVKGPSSSLYGSEALAGVINIITDKPKTSSLNASARYGSFNTGDFNLSGSIRKNKFAYQGFGNIYRTDGFSIRPNSVERAIAPIKRYTMQHNLSWYFNEKTNLSLNLRWNDEQIKNIISVTNNGNVTTSEGAENNKDLNATLQLAHRINSRLKNTSRLYGTRYESLQELATTNGSPYTDYFKQQFGRIENQTDFVINDQFELNAGVGYTIETANSTRYDNSTNTKTNQIGFAFVQSEWKPFSKLTIIGGARYDNNELYAAAFSPKLALQYKVSDQFSLKASIGRGFKAPDFRQLYLNFTNAAAGGYSVLGTVEAQKIIGELERIGQIASLENDFYRLGELKPEFSTGLNIGGNYIFSKKISFSFNAFRNNIENLIDSRLVAYRLGGAQIFSYLNVKNAFTQGVEADFKYALSNTFSLTGGYQILITGDKDEINRINDGKVFTRDANGFSRLMQRSEYVGLPNRSKHMGNLRIQYENKTNFFANLRFNYRSKWAVTDIDGNGLFNTNDEFAKGFVQVNTALGKTFHNSLRLQLGCDNLFDYSDINNLPNFPGRRFYTSIAYNFLHKKIK